MLPLAGTGAPRPGTSNRGGRLLEEAKAERARKKEAQRKVVAEKKAALKLERQRKQELKQRSKTGKRGIEDEEQSDAATSVVTIVSTSKAETNHDSSTGISVPQPQLLPPWNQLYVLEGRTAL